MKLKELKGGHVFAMIAVFFAVIFVANAAFITLALDTFPGQVVDKPYERGVKYNEVLAAKAEQEALGWSAEIERASLSGNEAEIVVRFRSPAGETLYGLNVSGVLRRPASDKGDHALAFVPGDDGAYIVWAESIGGGAWDLTARAEAANGETFTLEKRLILQ